MIEYDVINTPIVDLANKIILYAVKNRASDIHFDPIEDGLKVRIRIDGVLKDHTIIPKETERNLITRIKLISGMNITENRLPQDGAIKGKIDDNDLDMRVSCLPTNQGEKIVVRILDYSKSLEGLQSLGFTNENLEKVRKMISIPNGIVLVTGATGTGKSTTTYSFLQELNKEGTNIITVEDPIEMNIEGINQVQVNPEIGLDFATVLRSILRQDPNIILIGEIRDSETAKIAIRSSITGHLVFSTVHTNDSLSTIERLIDMEVERYLLASSLEGVISQRLARRLCKKCKTLRPTTEFERETFKKILDKDILETYEAHGCDECINGYHGRIAIQEVLPINDKIRDLIANEDTSKEELRDAVYTSGVSTLLQDGLNKVVSGETSFDEIYRLIEIEKNIDDEIDKLSSKDAKDAKKKSKAKKEEQEI